MLVPTRSELEKNYKNAVFDALTQYQFIESVLKDCILESNRIIRVRTIDVLEVNCSKKKLDEMGLQALTTLFKRTTKNKTLAAEIKKEANHRNKIAHASCFGHWQDLMSGIGEDELHKSGCEIQKHADKASELVGQLCKELKQLKNVADS